MELTNATRMVAGYTMGIDPSAREHIVVVVKGTFRIPDRDGEVATLADEQVPLVMADTFTGEPGYSAPVHEADFPLRKPRCDILLNATAYAPEGHSAPRVGVGVKVGGWSKIIDVLVAIRTAHPTSTALGPQSSCCADLPRCGPERARGNIRVLRGLIDAR